MHKKIIATLVVVCGAFSSHAVRLECGSLRVDFNADTLGNRFFDGNSSLTFYGENIFSTGNLSGVLVDDLSGLEQYVINFWAHTSDTHVHVTMPTNLTSALGWINHAGYAEALRCSVVSNAR